MALEKRISELTAKVGAIEDTDLMVISDYNGATYDTKKVTGAQIKPYKTYLVSISQSGTSAPTVNYSYSELTSSVTLGRRGVGLYSITLSASEFTLDKTFVHISSGEGGVGVVLEAYRNSATQVYIGSSDSLSQAYMDSLLNDCQIEIKIIK